MVRGVLVCFLVCSTVRSLFYVILSRLKPQMSAWLSLSRYAPEAELYFSLNSDR